MKPRLMVIVPDRGSAWINKGEVVDRYFNPGDVFGHVDLVVTNHDEPDHAALQRMAGDATVAVHHLPTSRAHFVATLGWRPWALRRWSRRAVALVERLQPAQRISREQDGVRRCVVPAEDLVVRVPSRHRKPPRARRRPRR